MHTAMGCILIQLWTWQQPPDVANRNTILIVTGLTSFIVYHCVTDEFVLHVVLFFALSVSVAWKTRQIIRQKISDPNHRAKLGSFATAGTCASYLSLDSSSTVGTNSFATGTALFAYFLWNIDVNFCPTLTKWKHQIGLPWAVLLELHGVWHVLTSISTYIFMSMIEFLTGPELDESHGVGFSWPAKAVLQDLVPKRAANGGVYANGHANGSLKKRST